jgi:hypothetical protein
MSNPKLESLQKTKYLEIVFCLWEEGADSAHDEYPDLSVKELNTANAYYDSLRCEGCMCGSCVRVGDLASNLDKSPKDLIPIAALAAKLGKREYEKKA